MEKEENKVREESEEQTGQEELTQWHLGFCAAVELELKQYKEQLSFQREYTINKQALRMDLLIIKKDKAVEIDNEIGRIFRGHNILEFKSPKDRLSLDDYMKVLGYGYLYKAQEGHVGEIAAEDITLTFIREGYPKKLFAWFEEKNYVVKKAYDGIYYIEKDGFFATQVIVMKELGRENHTYLISLTSGMDEGDMKRLAGSVDSLTEKGDRDNAEALLSISLKANRKMYGNVKEVGYGMGSAFREFFQDWFDEAEIKGRNEGLACGRNEGILAGKAEAVIELLEDCGEVPGALRDMIYEQTDLGILKAWHKLAARAESVEEFERELGLVK